MPERDPPRAKPAAILDLETQVRKLERDLADALERENEVRDRAQLAEAKAARALLRLEEYARELRRACPGASWPTTI